MALGAPQLIGIEDPFEAVGGGGDPNAIDTLTGDVTGVGPGSAVTTLSTTGVTPGTYHRPVLTLDAKGRATAASSDPALPWVDIRDYGALLDGVTDDTSAWQSAVNVAGAHLVRMPAGTSLIAGTVTIAIDGVQIQGVGRGSVVKFAPTATPQSCFVIHNGGNPVWNTRISSLTFTSADNTRQKFMIDVIDGRWCEIDHIVSSDGTWTGAVSNGIRIRGHEFVHIHDNVIYADQPVSIGVNPNMAGYEFDHGKIIDCNLTANGSPVINIESGVCLTSVTLRGLAWVRGTYGLYASGLSAGTASYNLKIEDTRQEQMSAANHFIYISGGAGVLYQLEITNVTGPGPTGKGIYLRGVRETSLRNFRNVGCSGEILNVDGTVYELDWVNCDWGAAPASVSTSGQTISQQGNKNSLDYSQPLRPNGHMSLSSAQAPDVTMLGAANHASRTGVLTAGTQALLSFFDTNSAQGVIHVAFSGLGGEGGGTVILGPSNTYLVGGTSNFAVGNVGAKVCCFFNVAQNIYIINNLANTITWTAVADWTP
jgi:hypothetical protein